ncbi:uncharacterized protein LOC121745897 [Salvia splendens]|uniref:uncharacterized protein LOC121745897 n=1 Tax=Salvia splendens TaxID=180675 RepID=UPI001C27CB99|nr:uncharacterized protein LOC121745897 [Salvia splendens]
MANGEFDVENYGDADDMAMDMQEGDERVGGNRSTLIKAISTLQTCTSNGHEQSKRKEDLLGKYCSNGSPLAPTPTSRGSPTWKRLTKAWGHAHPHIRWLVGTGRIYFWDDIWLGDIPLRETCIDERANPMTTVSEFFTNGTWDVPKLQLLHDQAGLPQPIIDRIRNTPTITEDPDVPRWTLSRRGNFTLASTWEVSRSQGPIIQGLEDIWKAGLTTSMAIFNWRLLSNRIPVDSKLQWRKIELASKCNCCPHRPSTESLQHLFIQGVGREEYEMNLMDGSRAPLHHLG